jgi:hypothetical protein
MNTLWIFGDSFSATNNRKNIESWRKDYINWKGYTPLCYGEFISNELNLLHANYAIGGTDNYTIFESIIPHLNKINSNDIIIIGWSHTLRFRIANKMGGFNTIRLAGLDDVFELNKKTPYIDLSNDTIREMVLSRNSNLYINEVNNFITILNFCFKNNKIIHWSPFRQDLNGMKTTKSSIPNLETITDETGGVVDDTHFSENAHKLLSIDFINTIENYESFKNKHSLI